MPDLSATTWPHSSDLPGKTLDKSAFIRSRRGSTASNERETVVDFGQFKRPAEKQYREAPRVTKAKTPKQPRKRNVKVFSQRLYLVERERLRLGIDEHEAGFGNEHDESELDEEYWNARPDHKTIEITVGWDTHVRLECRAPSYNGNVFEDLRDRGLTDAEFRAYVLPLSSRTFLPTDEEVDDVRNGILRGPFSGARILNMCTYGSWARWQGDVSVAVRFSGERKWLRYYPAPLGTYEEVKRNPRVGVTVYENLLDIEEDPKFDYEVCWAVSMGEHELPTFFFHKEKPRGQEADGPATGPPAASALGSIRERVESPDYAPSESRGSGGAKSGEKRQADGPVGGAEGSRRKRSTASGPPTQEIRRNPPRNARAASVAR